MSQFPARDVVNIINWARRQQKIILASGYPLAGKSLEDAATLGIKQLERVRILPVYKIPIPKASIVIEQARKQGLCLEEVKGITFGYGIMVLKKFENDRHLLVHELTHLQQFERLGFAGFLRTYIADCMQYGYLKSPLELMADEWADKLTYEN